MGQDGILRRVGNPPGRPCAGAAQAECHSAAGCHPAPQWRARPCGTRPQYPRIREGAIPAGRFLNLGIISISTAAILVLQTRFKGRWDHFEIEKKALGDAALKLLTQRLLPFLPGK